jgi:hypothetical protein
MTEPRRTSIRMETFGKRPLYVVEVVGSKGSMFGVRSSFALARATAVKYGILLDAPCDVLAMNP